MLSSRDHRWRALAALIASTIVFPTVVANAPRDVPTIVFENGLLTADVRNQSLASTLQEISQQIGVPIIGAASIRDRTVTVRFAALPLQDALREVLKHYDYFAFYGADDASPAALSAIWVYPKGEGGGLVPLAPDNWAGSAELSRDLTHADPRTRARAVELLVARREAGAMNAVTQALSDSDETVRQRALAAALDAGMALPEAPLWDLLLNDASPLVRFLALGALVGPVEDIGRRNPEEVRPVVEIALRDPDVHVRDHAAQLLAQLGADTNSETHVSADEE